MSVRDRGRLLAVAAAGAILAAAGALTGGAAGQEVDCAEAMTTVDMVTCVSRDLEAAEAELEGAVAAAAEGLDEQGRALLQAAQSAWHDYRRAECERVRDQVRGGTLAPVLAGACMVDLTHTRILDLRPGGALVADPPEATVYWRNDPPLVDRFTCAGFVEARVGLALAMPEAGGPPELTALVRVGEQDLSFPLDSSRQQGVCGVDLTLSAVAGPQCPALRLDDGMCDALTLRWSAEQQGFTIERR